MPPVYHTAASANRRHPRGRLPFNDLMGLESGVKVGILFGYGISKGWDVTVQRVNGRDYFGTDGQDHSYDLWDVMTKVKLLDEDKEFVDVAVDVGTTVFWQDDGNMTFSGNAALLVEKSLWRFRMQSGVLYASKSDFDRTYSSQSGIAPDKYYTREDTFGDARPQMDTLAIPVGLSLALTQKTQLFGEMVFPVDGYHTGNGPSAAAGLRVNTHSHAFSLFFCNTSNGNFNSTMTGGYRRDALDVFGFDISIFF
jgi:hypothetical protein